MAFILMIARKSRVHAWHWRQIRRRRGDGLNPRLFIAGDDRHPLRRLLRPAGGLFQDLDFAIDAQSVRNLLLELGVAISKIVAHLARLDLLFAEYLAYRPLDQIGQAPVPCRRSVLARMAGQQARRPQLMRIAVVLGLVARQRYQPSLGFRRNYRLLAWSRSVVECRQRAVAQRPLDAALHGLMMRPELLRNGKKRWGLAVSEKHSCPFDPARPLGPRARHARQLRNLLVAHPQLDRLPPSCHDATPRHVNHKRGIHHDSSGSIRPHLSNSSGFMESVD